MRKKINSDVLGKKDQLLLKMNYFEIVSTCFMSLLEKAQIRFPHPRYFHYEKYYTESYTSHHTCLETNDFSRQRSITINHQQVNST